MQEYKCDLCGEIYPNGDDVVSLIGDQLKATGYKIPKLENPEKCDDFSKIVKERNNVYVGRDCPNKCWDRVSRCLEAPIKAKKVTEGQDGVSVELEMCGNIISISGTQWNETDRHHKNGEHWFNSDIGMILFSQEQVREINNLLHSNM